MIKNPIFKGRQRLFLLSKGNWWMIASANHQECQCMDVSTNAIA
jgi:hypothetical protein